MKKHHQNQHFKEIHSLQELLKSGYNLKNATIQSIDFTAADINWHALDLEFFGRSEQSKDGT